MDDYINQLLELISSAFYTKNTNRQLIDDDDYINEFADQYINGTPVKISDKTGIEKFQFPPIEKLSEEQIDVLLPKIEELLLSYNWEFIFPENVSNEVRYGFITGKWDTKHVFCKQGIVQIETCKFDDKNCPFPAHCSICNKLKDNTDHALCKGKVDFDSLTPDFESETTPEMRKNIDKFKELMRTSNSSEYITGIHNYCDGRCNKCDFTKRCSSYALNEEMNNVTNNDDNESSDDNLMIILKATTEFIEEELEKRGIDAQETINELSNTDNVVNDKKHPLEIKAESYAEKVKRWLDSNQREIESRIVSEQTTIKNYFESITWFQLFIPAKVSRALSIFKNSQMQSSDEYDSNGSAKAALLGMDESIEAWENLMNNIPQKEDSILNILRHLSEIRAEVEKTFPKAREFKRPGFDTGD
ncbi:hypothetical protein [Carboxylicivirga linearis]|uniref:Uncharacterized protein n=1 Tax=Carboxylicivirga linearis TaxID=1628157 RepID=A0ABS5JZS2_9BACT|nr:hypothetical protein [Carboxylicivirga linearis]MBS2100363.1 hypothetical protein [Carboxylicivirga linearis]